MGAALHLDDVSDKFLSSLLDISVVFTAYQHNKKHIHKMLLNRKGSV